MSTNDYTPVTFTNSRGETISNDPVYLARQTLAAHGDNGAEQEALTDRYEDMAQKDLKLEAVERGVELKGIKTVAELRATLRNLDTEEAKASEADTKPSDTQA